MNIIFITGNYKKFESAQKQFKDTDIELEYYKHDAIEPNVNDITVIAGSKVMNAYQMVNKPCIAHDSGFYINNFPNQPGFPGAFPNREILNEGKMGLEGLLDKMKNVTYRCCYFMECLAYFDGDEVKYFYGISPGTLATSIRGKKDKGWSLLWQVFIPDNHIHTLAEMSDEERSNRLDNHTSAFEEFISYIKSKESQLIKKGL